MFIFDSFIASMGVDLHPKKDMYPIIYSNSGAKLHVENVCNSRKYGEGEFGIDNIDLSGNKVVCGASSRDSLYFRGVDDHRMFIATGYGTEAYLTDIRCNQIIDQILTPAFQQNDFYGGIDNATTEMMKYMTGAYEGQPYGNANDAPPTLIIIIIIILIIFFISRRTKGGGGTTFSRRGPTYWGGGGFGGFGGGGFGGGGGGGGFGGFGGGGFGGGGAGGSW